MSIVSSVIPKYIRYLIGQCEIDKQWQKKFDLLVINKSMNQCQKFVRKSELAVYNLVRSTCPHLASRLLSGSAGISFLSLGKKYWNVSMISTLLTYDIGS